jgi:hypothetical protein
MRHSRLSTSARSERTAVFEDLRQHSARGIILASSHGGLEDVSAAAGPGPPYSVGVNTTGARPISLISPIIRITWWGTQRSIAGALSSRLIVNLAKTGWLKSIRTHARMSRRSLGGLPDDGFCANARNSLASCGGRSGLRRTKYLLGRVAIFVLYAFALVHYANGTFLADAGPVCPHR